MIVSNRRAMGVSIHVYQKILCKCLINRFEISQSIKLQNQRFDEQKLGTLLNQIRHELDHLQ